MKLISNSPEVTFKIGHRLGLLLKEGDVVALLGELGSGKTIFVKGVASAFSIPEREIASASFTIISEHRGIIKGETIAFNHMDLYRLEGSELSSLGLEEYIGKGVSIIEWAERLGKLPEGFIKVSFNIIDQDVREITIEGINEEDWDNR